MQLFTSSARLATAFALAGLVVCLMAGDVSASRPAQSGVHEPGVIAVAPQPAAGADVESLRRATLANDDAAGEMLLARHPYPGVRVGVGYGGVGVRYGVGGYYGRYGISPGFGYRSYLYGNPYLYHRPYYPQIYYGYYGAYRPSIYAYRSFNYTLPRYGVYYAPAIPAGAGATVYGGCYYW